MALACLLAQEAYHHTMGRHTWLLVRRGLALIEPIALRIAVQKPAAATALVACATDLIICGASVPTQRAFVMAAIFFGTILLFDRTALSLRSFALALVAVAALHPESVMSAGFQMSLAATGALIATYGSRSEHTRNNRDHRAGSGHVLTLKSLFVTSGASAVSTAPFALFHFGRVAAWRLAANFLAMPVISFASAPLAAVSLVAVPWGLPDLAIGRFGKSLEAVLRVAHALDRWGALDGRIAGPAGHGAARPCRGIVGPGGGEEKPLLVLHRAVCGAGCVGLEPGAAHAAAWAPSGDVLLQNDERYLRACFVGADELGPMRQASLFVAQDCCAGRCRIETPAGPVTLPPDNT